MKLFCIAICMLNIILIEANQFCDLEPLYCEGRPHVGCNKITNSDTADEIIELTPYLRQRLLNNLNKFRVDVAFGLRQNVTHIPVSNMQILQWNANLELLSGNASIKLKHNSVQNLCYATSDYTDPILISTSLNDQHAIMDINSKFVDQVTTNLIEKYQSLVLGNPSSHDIGCAVTRAEKLNSYSVACILYGIEDLDYFKYGKPCSECESLECDSTYRGLCVSGGYNIIEPQPQVNTTIIGFQMCDIHIYAIYALLCGLFVLIILMLILIKYLCQYSSHISL